MIAMPTAPYTASVWARILGAAESADAEANTASVTTEATINVICSVPAMNTRERFNTKKMMPPTESNGVMNGAK